MKRKTSITRPALSVYERIRKILDSARSHVARSVNTTQVVANWMVGREIVEEEQTGKKKAGYGDAMLVHLATRLVTDFGPGYSGTNLRWFRQFYLEYGNLMSGRICHAPRDKSIRSTESSDCTISHAVRDFFTPNDFPAAIGYAVRSQSWFPGQIHPNLSWTHYRTLLRVDKSEARAFYEIEAIKNNWSARELERQINSLLYERLALSKDKKGLMRLAIKGQEVQHSTDLFKDPVVMEFVGIPEFPKLVESDLEGGLINNRRQYLPADTSSIFPARQSSVMSCGVK